MSLGIELCSCVVGGRLILPVAGLSSCSCVALALTMMMMPLVMLFIEDGGDDDIRYALLFMVLLERCLCSLCKFTRTLKAMVDSRLFAFCLLRKERWTKEGKQ